jgi:hypothetical protein
MRGGVYRCACEFGKVMGDNNPWHYPRVGMADNVLYRGNWIVEHKPSGTTAIVGVTRGTLAPEADECCHKWFDKDAPKPPSPPRPSQG